MRAKDFDIDYSSGLFNCCADHVYNCDDDVELGTVLECDDCGLEMILEQHPKTNKVMWRCCYR